MIIGSGGVEFSSQPTPSWQKASIRVLSSILETAELVRSRSISPVDLARDCLARIERLNPTLNAYITVTAESALEQARQAETEIQHGGWRGSLHGIPLALKDLIDTAGVRTTAASALFKDRTPAQDAEIVTKLKDAGAVILGKQNLHEFAYGGSSLISYYGEVRNAWNPEHIAGGSSGGSATAVSAELCYGAIGTDTAGSIREPAALCGVVGLKPSYGLVSTQGVIPLSQSLDHVGPIARTVADCAAILEVIAGGDYCRLLQQHLPAPWRIGVPRKFFYEDLDLEIASAAEQAFAMLDTMGVKLREIDLAVPTDRTLQAAEAYAYHAQFVARTPELYQPETLRLINAGQHITSDQVAASQRELSQVREQIREIFRQVDLLVTPTTPVAAPRISELKQNPELLRERELQLLRNTRPFNVWELPAISVPCGFTSGGLPIGLQIAGPRHGELSVLQLAHAYEQSTEWHKRRPRGAGALAREDF
jgi:aspartyl-tRNA(Asn)/glutamyl-tRNA(Gln) amidotransferase subunit A